METFFSSGRVADLLLAVLAAEAAWIAWRRRTGRSAPEGVVPFLLAGAAFALALRFALTGGWWGWVGLCLAASGVAHVWDLARRWR
ncbi:hypothetical protein ACE7GA_06190 [Roseomonas sp. CCTCC AB2023176]|uniref:hypothetical protein n=1 Tax=Roseomonas sp. CCTCC AB2023176 TaxID=3342640 RepID=UPI0035E0FD4C